MTTFDNDDDHLYVSVHDPRTSEPIDVARKVCCLCLRPVTRQRGLRPLPGHLSHYICPVCRSLENDPILIDWWLAFDIEAQRAAIKLRHGIDPLTWDDSITRATQWDVSEDVDGVLAGVWSSGVALTWKVPRCFWDVLAERPGAVRDAHPDVD